MQALQDGAATLEASSLFVNYPLIRWPGGGLTVDPDLKSEVAAFARAYFDPKGTQQQMQAHIAPAVDRFRVRQRFRPFRKALPQ